MKQRIPQLTSRRLKNKNVNLENENHPYLSYSVVQKQLKGEDVLFLIDDLSKCDENRLDLSQWSVYCVCDGHGGPNAAKFFKRYLGQALCKVLPKGNKLPCFKSEEGSKFCESIRHALVKVFTSLHDAFGSKGCRTSGTTVSVVLMCGWLMTVANAGDSDVYLDMKQCIIEMTCSHKVSANKNEVKRLEASGVKIGRLSRLGPHPPVSGEEGRGPLRVWPGGIAMSRSIGDLDSGPYVLPVPHIKQIIISKSGGRLILASDGLWDHMSGEDACKLSRNFALSETPKHLLHAAQEKAGGRLYDDISILVLDVMENGDSDFSDVIAQEQTHKRVHSVKKLIKRAMVKRSDSDGSSKDKTPELYADVDGNIDYCNSLNNIVPAITELGQESSSFRQPMKKSANVKTKSAENKYKKEKELELSTSSAMSMSEDEKSPSSSSNSETWDMCESHWDCCQGSSYTCWETDDRDILDSAQNYVHTTGTSNKKNSSKMKLIMVQEKHVKETSIDLMDTSMNAVYGMNTIHEPIRESDDDYTN